MKSTKNGWTLLLLILAGVVLGGFIGSLSGLSWLNYGDTFGLDSPIVLSLGLVVLTFGLTIKITVASLLGIAIALLVYHWI